MSYRHHWRAPLVAGMIGAVAVSSMGSTMLGRFFWRLGVFLAACWSLLLLALVVGSLASAGLSPDRAYLHIALAILIGDAVILGLAAGVAWVCGVAPWARQ
jgi:hypothetical protein